RALSAAFTFTSCLGVSPSECGGWQAPFGAALVKRVVNPLRGYGSPLRAAGQDDRGELPGLGSRARGWSGIAIRVYLM
ncbi:hypothetical protein, partial [Metallibacterium sp.]|uniref:hypothetical protein n=1 Tax=Metallibacterium sp. TaxID=2940281 RepID=UPI002638205A